MGIKMATAENNIFEHAYKGAIALNNYGIAFLEHHCYEQAALTLKDSMQSMQLAFHVSEQEGLFPPCKTKIDRYLQDCFSRLSNPVVVNHPFSICIHTITGAQSVYPISRSITHKAQQVAFNPIRIDDPSIECNYGQDELDLNAATVVYNFAIATWCISKTVHPSINPLKALSLFKLSSNSLSRLEMECEDDEELRTIMGLNAIVVGTILRVFEQQKTRQQVAGGVDNQDREGFELRLEGLQMKIQWMDEIFSYWTEIPPVASAA